jgi:anti-sigma regulatory factor (Ser/Thr protein kinase)
MPHLCHIIAATPLCCLQRIIDWLAPGKPSTERGPKEMSNGGPKCFPADARLQPSELRNTAVMTRPRRRVFPGRSEQVAHARRFVAQALEGSPLADEAVLCVSELATNALVHSASGKGGEFEVVVCRGRDSALVAVYDDGSASPPTVRGLDAASENGRGLGVVALTASRWGHFGGQSGRGVWFELCWNPSWDDGTVGG